VGCGTCALLMMMIRSESFRDVVLVLGVGWARQDVDCSVFSATSPLLDCVCCVAWRSVTMPCPVHLRSSHFSMTDGTLFWYGTPSEDLQRWRIGRESTRLFGLSSLMRNHWGEIHTRNGEHEIVGAFNVPYESVASVGEEKRLFAIDHCSVGSCGKATSGDTAMLAGIVHYALDCAANSTLPVDNFQANRRHFATTAKIFRSGSTVVTRPASLP
jgi:hypothetical protein